MVQDRLERQNGKVRGVAQRAKEIVMEETRSIVEERGINEKAASRVHDYGETLGMLRERVQRNEDTRIGSYLSDVTMRVERIAERVGEGDYRGTLRETRALAADHPELFLGLAFAVGTYAGRMVRDVLQETHKAEHGPETGIQSMTQGGF